MEKVHFKKELIQKFAQQLEIAEIAVSPFQFLHFRFNTTVNQQGLFVSATDPTGQPVKLHQDSMPVPDDINKWKVYILPPDAPLGCFFFNGQLK